MCKFKIHEVNHQVWYLAVSSNYSGVNNEAARELGTSIFLTRTK